VDDLLDVSRITHGKIRIEREPVHLQSVVTQAIEISMPLIHARSHRLSVSEMNSPVTTVGDLTRLTQVVANLLNNAAKYTDSGGEISLAVECDGDAAVIRVRDSGVGLAPDTLESVFEPFTQVELALDRSQGGLGIGLTLARRLVELHGGSLTAKSDGPGRGSEFVVRLPLAPGQSTPTNGHASRRVLVADDNVDAAENLASLVRGHGHDVRVAHSGPQALKAADSFQPELVVLDVGLSGINGFDVAQRLRRHPATASAILVALTTNGQAMDGSRIRDAGFDRHVVKPVDPETIRLVLSDPGRGN
jgi:CheY-like chemotaxis protein/anti-sigma regulatory factor (Ser/Thr protein kinase)